MSRLIGKTALVTGAATGIGRAVAQRFAREGARSAVWPGGESLREAALTYGGAAVLGDVTRRTDVACALDACDERLDIIVSAAGFIALDAPAVIEDETWRRVFAVNVDGPMASLPRRFAVADRLARQCRQRRLSRHIQRFASHELAMRPPKRRLSPTRARSPMLMAPRRARHAGRARR